MLFYTVGQGYAFLAMLGCGLLLGLWYSFTRALRRLLEAGPWLTALLDAVFAGGALFLLILGLFFVNRLDLRLYALLGAAAGTALYLGGVAPILDAAGRFLSKIARKIGQNQKTKNFFEIFVR